MKKLDEFNKERAERHAQLNNINPAHNGIECPKCGCELFDSAPAITLTSWPPQKNTVCNACGYIGYRVA